MSELPATFPCKDCGGKACICEDEGMWAAHCMDCDNSVGETGAYDACCGSKEEAIYLWNHLNMEKGSQK